MPYASTPLAVRFARQRDERGPGECWPWLGARKRPSGYGVIGAGGKKGRNLYAHRVAWELAHGAIPSGMTIDHLCRNKGCVNPAHMEVVTSAENTRRAAKLSMDTVREIRELSAQGHRNAELGRRFNIDSSEISRVVMNEIWPDPEYVQPVLPSCGMPTKSGPCRRRAGWGTGQLGGPCVAHA